MPTPRRLTGTPTLPPTDSPRSSFSTSSPRSRGAAEPFAAEFDDDDALPVGSQPVSPAQATMLCGTEERLPSVPPIRAPRAYAPTNTIHAEGGWEAVLAAAELTPVRGATHNAVRHGESMRFDENDERPFDEASPASSSDTSVPSPDLTPRSAADGPPHAPTHAGGATSRHPALRQMGMLEIEPLRSHACSHGRSHQLGQADAAALEWARSREVGELEEAGGGVSVTAAADAASLRGGVLLHGRGWSVEAVLAALIGEERRQGLQPTANASAIAAGGNADSGSLLRAKSAGGAIGLGGHGRCRRTLILISAARFEQLEFLLSTERLPFVTYEGSGAKRRAAVSSGCPVVVATYGVIIAKETRPPLLSSTMPGWRTKHPATASERGELRTHLHTLEWHRVVLLDAQLASNPSTQRAKAVGALRAERRWAVTGPDAKVGSGKGRVEPTALLALVGVECARSSWRTGGIAGRLVREARGDLATLSARGCDDVGETPEEEDDIEDDEDEGF